MNSHYRLLLTFVLTFVLILCSVKFSDAQDSVSVDSTFDQGLQLYKNAKYQEAGQVFAKLKSPESLLFAGKSFFAAGDYLQAQSYLAKVPSDSLPSINLEARYTAALVAFQLNQYDQVLQILNKIRQDDRTSNSLRQSASSFYQSTLSYLTLDQRKDVFLSISEPRIRLDIMESLVGQVDFATLQSLYNQFTAYLPDSSKAPLQTSRLESALKDSADYAFKYPSPSQDLEVPKGISYDIGVALPLFKPETAEFKVTRGLYNGILFAAEEFNQRHAERKVFIRHRNTTHQIKKADAVFNRMVWSHPLDAVIGPLFSESAHSMAKLAEQYGIPLVTPLANSDTLNLHNPYVFQVNPTFSIRGRKMARYAVKNLGLDTMAVIAQKNALGYESAFAFRDQAERLGAKISYFFVEDFASKAYDLSNYTKYFTADQELRDSLNIQQVDAIYAPFTGQAAQTLIDLLMTDLEAANSNAVILGSAEWGAFEMQQKRIRNFDMYYPEADPLTADTSQYRQFDQAYENRFGSSPTKFSYIGYDSAQLLLKALDRIGNPSLLKKSLRDMPQHNGLTGPIHFRGHQINQEIDIYKIKNKP
mgnify:CR=1 FL=1